MERTFVAIKPDGVERGLIGEIITRFEKKGYKIVAMKLMKISFWTIIFSFFYTRTFD